MVVWANLIGGDCDWQLIAFVRALLAFLFALLLAVSAGVRLVVWRPRILWLRSLAGSGSMVCTFYALRHMDPAHVVTLTNMFPIWIALLSWPLAQERPSGGVWLSVGSGILGVVLIENPQFAQGNFSGFTEGNFTVLAALGASMFTAVAMMGLNRLQGLDSRAIVVHFSGVAAGICLASYVLFPHQDKSPFAMNVSTLVLLLAIGVSATLGQLCLTKAFASSGAPAKVSVINLSQLVFVMVINWLLAEWKGAPYELNGVRLLGTALIVAPTAWLLLRNARRATKRKTPAEAGVMIPKLTSSPSLPAAAISSKVPAPASSSVRSGSGRAAGGLS